MHAQLTRGHTWKGVGLDGLIDPFQLYKSVLLCGKATGEQTPTVSPLLIPLCWLRISEGSLMSLEMATGESLSPAYSPLGAPTK